MSAFELAWRCFHLIAIGIFINSIYTLYFTIKFLYGAPLIVEIFTKIIALILFIAQIFSGFYIYPVAIMLVRAILIKIFPEFSRKFHLDWTPSSDSTGLFDIDGRQLKRTWLSAPIMMTVYLYFFFILTISISILAIYGGAETQYNQNLSEKFSVLIGAAGAFSLLVSFGGLMSGVKFSLTSSVHIGNVFGTVFLEPDHPFSQRVAKLAGKLDLPPPRVGLTGVTNAFAMGPNAKKAVVVMGIPLLEMLTDDEVDAIIGHELGHIVSRDMMKMQIAEGFQSSLCDMATIFTTVGMSRAKDRINQRLILNIGNMFRYTAFIVTEIFSKRMSRQREFYADAIGAALTSPLDMANALRRVHGMERSSLESRYGYLMFDGSSFGSLFATHPSVEKRLKALETGSHLRRLPRRP